MTTTNIIADSPSAPLDPDWTVENLAQRILGAIAAQPPGSEREFVFAVDDATDRQSRRLLRPLLAYLATRSAIESGLPADLYGGYLSFERPGPTGPVWVLARFENRPRNVSIAIRGSNSAAAAESRPASRPQLSPI